MSLNNNDKKIFELKTGSDGINGVNQQCLVYYYYMSPIVEKTITIRKEETSGGSVTIDSVSSSPINAWIRRNIPFNAEAPGYKVKSF